MKVNHNFVYNGGEYQLIVFDEPLKEYYDISLIAASSSDRLAHNYRKPIHKNKEYLTLVIDPIGEPRTMWATERDPSLPANVARGFCRFFTNPKFRISPNQPKIEAKIFEFYSSYPEYNARLGINTIFFTRNYTEKKSIDALARSVSKYGYIKYPNPIIYKNCPQWFFILGDPQFCQLLPKYT